MEVLRKIWSYLTFQKEEGSGFIKSMHTINKIAILLFLVAMVILLRKFI